MKKFISLLLVFAMLFTLCMALTSCNIIKEDEVEECDHVDKDNDKRCDDCDEKVKDIHKHKDGDKDYVCDDCDEVLEYGRDDSDDCDEHVDNNADGFCDECGVDIEMPEPADRKSTRLNSSH